MQSEPIASYINGAMRNVEGWLTQLDAELMATIALHQNASRVGGAVGEIGVHHGRTFVALALALKDSERAFAIDVFDRQYLNKDKSGCGDEAVFRDTLKRHGVEESRVRVLHASSLDVGWPDIERAVGDKVRVFSIDGGHTADVVENDFAIADASLCDAGVVISDDYFDSGYPGVSEGTARFLLGHPQALCPFAIGDSRMFLCRPAFAETYRRALAASPFGRRHIMTATMWGSSVLIYRTPHRLVDRLRGARITQAVLRQSWGQRWKSPVRRLLAGRD